MIEFYMNRTFLIAAFAALAVFLLLAVSPSTRNRASRGAMAGTESFLEGVRIRAMSAGEPVWTLITDRAVLVGASERALLNTVTVEIPSEGMTILASRGSYDLASGALELEGGVQAHSGGLDIETSSARLLPARSEVASDDEVTVTGKGFNIKGKGFRARDQRVRVLRNVRAEIQ